MFRTLRQPSDNNSRGSGENAFKIERDMQLVFEKQEKPSSVPGPSSHYPHRHSTKPSHPQIDQQHDQSGTSYGRLEDLRQASPLRRQDQEEPQEQ
jgi:hypothetical protein